MESQQPNIERVGKKSFIVVALLIGIAVILVLSQPRTDYTAPADRIATNGEKIEPWRACVSDLSKKADAFLVVMKSNGKASLTSDVIRSHFPIEKDIVSYIENGKPQTVTLSDDMPRDVTHRLKRAVLKVKQVPHRAIPVQDSSNFNPNSILIVFHDDDETKTAISVSMDSCSLTGIYFGANGEYHPAVQNDVISGYSHGIDSLSSKKPGEECTKDSECRYHGSKCVCPRHSTRCAKKKCHTYDIGLLQSCDKYRRCDASLGCQGSPGECRKKNGHKCDKDKECGSLHCLAKTCSVVHPHIRRTRRRTLIDVRELLGGQKPVQKDRVIDIVSPSKSDMNEAIRTAIWINDVLYRQHGIRIALCGSFACQLYGAEKPGRNGKFDMDIAVFLPFNPRNVKKVLGALVNDSSTNIKVEENIWQSESDQLGRRIKLVKDESVALDLFFPQIRFVGDFQMRNRREMKQFGRSYFVDGPEACVVYKLIWFRSEDCRNVERIVHAQSKLPLSDRIDVGEIDGIMKQLYWKEEERAEFWRNVSSVLR